MIFSVANPPRRADYSSRAVFNNGGFRRCDLRLAHLAGFCQLLEKSRESTGRRHPAMMPAGCAG
jgi:hypothetical protein